MTRTRQADAGHYSVGERARAFMRGLAEFEPLVSVAREGLQKEGLGQDQRVNYALRIAESRTTGCAAIAGLITALAAGPEPEAVSPYRSARLELPIPLLAQERLCELYRTRYDEAMSSLLSEEKKAGDTESLSRLVDIRMSSRLEKARGAYDLLKCNAIASEAARRHLSAVFCDAARDVLSGGLAFNEDAHKIREAIIREFGGESIRGIVPYGLSPYESGRILSIVSERLCGSDMSFIPPRR